MISPYSNEEDDRKHDDFNIHGKDQCINKKLSRSAEHTLKSEHVLDCKHTTNENRQDEEDWAPVQNRKKKPVNKARQKENVAVLKLRDQYIRALVNDDSDLEHCIQVEAEFIFKKVDFLNTHYRGQKKILPAQQLDGPDTLLHGMSQNPKVNSLSNLCKNLTILQFLREELTHVKVLADAVRERLLILEDLGVCCKEACEMAFEDVMARHRSQKSLIRNGILEDID